MDLNCKYCGQDIRPDDLDGTTRVARCWNCHAVFEMDGPQPQPSPADEAEPERHTRPLPAERQSFGPLPPGLKVEIGDTNAANAAQGGAYRTAHQQGEGLRIVRRWLHWRYGFLLAFAIFWDGFLVHWYLNASMGLPDMLSFSLVPGIHVLVGCLITYTAIAGLVNRTTITVTQGVMQIRHSPLPWLGNRRLPVDQLEQLYCEEIVSRSKNGTTRTYAVTAIMGTGRPVRLLKGMHEPIQALTIERIIEEALGIADVSVPGEYYGKGAAF